MIFNQLITEEPKYQAKALIVVTNTIKKLIDRGAAVVVTIPSITHSCKVKKTLHWYHDSVYLESSFSWLDAWLFIDSLKGI